MATTLRRNPIRNRSAPKRFEDEKFVSGAIDRYQHCYDANRVGKYDVINGDENYYTTRDGRKFATFIGTLIILCIDTHYVTLQKVY